MQIAGPFLLGFGQAPDMFPFLTGAPYHLMDKGRGAHLWQEKG